MKLSQRLQIYIFSLLFGAAALAAALFSSNEILRAAFALPYIFVLWPYIISLNFFPKSLPLIERFVIGSGLGIMMLYPLGVLLTLIEGKSGEIIFSSHLISDAVLLFGTNFLFLGIAVARGLLKEKDTFEKPNYLHAALCLLGLAFLFFRINRADLNMDEVDIGYTAYDLVDGTVAGRNAYVLSFYAHTPLAIIANHFGMQFINNSGFDLISDWVVRAVNAFVAFLTLITAALTSKKNSKYFTALLLALLLIAPPFLFAGRILLREAFIMYFLVLSLFMLQRFMKSNSRADLVILGLFAGAILLSKSTCFYLVPLFALPLLKDKKIKEIAIYFFVVFLTFLPIIVYNIGAYIQTGYMDILFSKIFGIYHVAGYTGTRAHDDNLISNFLIIVKSIADQLSVLGLLLLVFGFIKSKKQDLIPLIIVLASIAFFSLSGVRAYYLSYLAPLLIYFIVRGIDSSKFLKIPLGILLLVNLSILTWNTHFSSSYSIDQKWNDTGRSGALDIGIDVLRPYSLTIRTWVESFGWRELEKFADENFDENTVVALDSKIDDMTIRKYLNVNQVVEKFYLGENLKEDFKYFWFKGEPEADYDYAVYKFEEGIEGYEIKNPSGKTFFIIQEK